MQITASRARRLGAAAVVAVTGAVLAATALAAPVREGTVSASAPLYEWDGGPGNGSGQGVAAARCTPVVYECEDTLVEVKDPGDLFAEAKGGAGANDIDIAIYKSDASGTTAGNPADGDAPDAEDISEGPNAKTTLKKAQPGFYVVRVRTFDGIQAVWKGSALLKPPVAAVPPPATTPAPSTTPAPTATPAPASKPAAKERRNACKKKAKKIKNKKKRKKALKKCKKIK